MEEFEPFHWYIDYQSAKRFLVTLLFFGLSLLLLIFLFLRFIRMHASFPSSSNDNDDVSNSVIVVTRQNIRRREMGVVAAAAASSEVIKSLPIFMHSRLSESTRLRVGGEDCCICLGVFEDGEMIKFTGGANFPAPRPAEAPPPTKGLDAESIQTLPAVAYVSLGVKDMSECSICLGLFEEVEIVKVMPECCHVFHGACVDTWLSTRPSCPLCRASLDSVSA
nr:RING-H2 finger protein ATL66-like [Ipomoea trifida]